MPNINNNATYLELSLAAEQFSVRTPPPTPKPRSCHTPELLIATAVLTLTKGWNGTRRRHQLATGTVTSIKKLVGKTLA